MSRKISKALWGCKPIRVTNFSLLLTLQPFLLFEEEWYNTQAERGFWKMYYISFPLASPVGQRCSGREKPDHSELFTVCFSCLQNEIQIGFTH